MRITRKKNIHKQMKSKMKIQQTSFNQKCKIESIKIFYKKIKHFLKMELIFKAWWKVDYKKYKVICLKKIKRHFGNYLVFLVKYAQNNVIILSDY